jgi:hypothetical protein
VNNENYLEEEHFTLRRQYVRYPWDSGDNRQVLQGRVIKEKIILKTCYASAVILIM